MVQCLQSSINLRYSKMKNFSSGAQLALFIFTHVLGITISILTFYWAGEYIGFHWDGFGKYVWHPTFMVLGTVYLLGIALCAYRLTSCKKNVQTMTHQILMIVMVLMVIFALAVVIDIKSDHFTTLHGWLGLITVVVLFLEVPLFIIVYGFGCCPNDVQSNLMPLHKYSGIIILLLSLASNLTGLQSSNNPTIFAEKMIINVIGLLIFIFSLIILFVLIEKKNSDFSSE